jgi:hypothetical protein
VGQFSVGVNIALIGYKKLKRDKSRTSVENLIQESNSEGDTFDLSVVNSQRSNFGGNLTGRQVVILLASAAMLVTLGMLGYNSMTSKSKFEDQLIGKWKLDEPDSQCGIKKGFAAFYLQNGLGGFAGETGGGYANDPWKWRVVKEFNKQLAVVEYVKEGNKKISLSLVGIKAGRLYTRLLDGPLPLTEAEAQSTLDKPSPTMLSLGLGEIASVKCTVENSALESEYQLMGLGSADKIAAATQSALSNSKLQDFQGTQSVSNSGNLLIDKYTLPPCVPVESSIDPSDGSCFVRRPKFDHSYPIKSRQYKSLDGNETFFGIDALNNTEAGAVRELSVECHYAEFPEKKQTYTILFGEADAPLLYQYLVSKFESTSRIKGSIDRRGGISLSNTPWVVNNVDKNGVQLNLKCNTVFVIIPSRKELAAINAYIDQLSNQNWTNQHNASLAKGDPLERLLRASKAIEAPENSMCDGVRRELVTRWYPVVQKQIQAFGLERGRTTVDQQIDLVIRAYNCLPRDYAN